MCWPCLRLTHGGACTCGWRKKDDVCEGTELGWSSYPKQTLHQPWMHALSFRSWWHENIYHPPNPLTLFLPSNSSKCSFFSSSIQTCLKTSTNEPPTYYHSNHSGFSILLSLIASWLCFVLFLLSALEKYFTFHYQINVIAIVSATKKQVDKWCV